MSRKMVEKWIGLHLSGAYVNDRRVFKWYCLHSTRKNKADMIRLLETVKGSNTKKVIAVRIEVPDVK